MRRLLLVVGLVLLCAGPARANDYSVTTNLDLPQGGAASAGTCDVGAPSHDCSLRAAVQAAQQTVGDDTITLQATTYTLDRTGSGEDAGKTGDLDIKSGGVTITGAARDTTVIVDAFSVGDVDRIFDVTAFDAPLTLNDLTLQNGRTTTQGGAIRSAASVLALNDVRVTGTTGNSAIYADAAVATQSLSLSDALIDHNTVTQNVVVAGPNATGGGATAGLSISGTTFDHNTVTATGAGVGDVVRFAGGSTAADATANVTITNSTFSNNTATATTVALVPQVPGHKLTFTATVTGSSFLTNTVAAGVSGGLLVSIPTVVNPGSSLTISNSTFDNNHALGAGALGIGVFQPMTTQISQTTISANQGQTVGGMSVDGDGPLSLSNSTIDGNTQLGVAALAAGGLLATGQGSMTLLHTTIGGNGGGTSRRTARAPVAPAGLTVGSGTTVTVTSSIIAANTPANCATGSTGTLTSGGTNIDSAVSCGFTFSGDESSTDPLLAALADNGGPTKTRGLGDGSAAIDKAAAATCPASDQRGTVRPQGTGCDIGAYEFVPTPTATPTATPTVVQEVTPTPSPAPEATPTPTPTPTPAAKRLTAADVLSGLPSAKKCVSKRSFKIHVRVPKGASVTQAAVAVNGKRVTVRKGSKLTSAIDLRGFVKGTFKVKITLTLKGGKTVSGTRTYHTCVKKTAK